MSSDAPWSVRGVEPETREAAKLAARRAGLTLGQWLNRSIREKAAEELGGRHRPAGEPPALPVPASAAPGAAERGKMPAADEAPCGLTPALSAEIDEIKFLIHEYLGLLLPAAEPIAELSRRLQDLTSLTQDIRRSAEAAERAAQAVAPLERTLLRLNRDSSSEQGLEGRHDRRGSGLGKLFGN